VELVFYERRYGISHKWGVVSEVYRRGGNLSMMDIRRYKKERVGSRGREDFTYSWIGLNNSKNT
jgi:hypothetical protein